MMLMYGQFAFGQPSATNPWAYSSEQQRNTGQRPWGQTPSSAQRDTRSERRNQEPRQSGQPCQSSQLDGPYSSPGAAPGYYGYPDPYLGMPHGLPGGGWMNPLYPVDPYMGWH